jgi:hypothetical protein
MNDRGFNGVNEEFRGTDEKGETVNMELGEERARQKV